MAACDGIKEAKLLQQLLEAYGRFVFLYYQKLAFLSFCQYIAVLLAIPAKLYHFAYRQTALPGFPQTYRKATHDDRHLPYFHFFAAFSENHH